MIDKNEFWNLIQDAYREADWETDKQMEILIDKLAIYSQEDILKFAKIAEIYDKEANQSKLHAAAYVMNGECSDTCFNHFRGWLISRGNEPYLNALKDPDSLVDLDIPYEDDNFENKKMFSVAKLAFNKSIGSNNSTNSTSSDNYSSDNYYERMKLFELEDSEIQDIVSDIDFAEDINVEWKKDDLEAIVPKLYSQYW